MMGMVSKQSNSTIDGSDELWQAVASRDRRVDGSFVFAVRTTGVFCRPSCPSRRPRRENVSFFDSPAEAVAAGFRACRRCLPDQPVGEDPRRRMVEVACRLIRECDDEYPTLEALARQIGLSPFHLQRTFKSVLGI